METKHPVSDFPALLQLQGLNGLQVGRVYNSPKQARRFVHFIAEHIRRDLVEPLQKVDFVHRLISSLCTQEEMSLGMKPRG